ncbi:helix-turn-helix transcriptional regulator [Dactylosporangium roseum]|uniref:Helix-turn-helix transcriptional regulator n=1 Tax=Dactylosporangium roseum TaxID=47989 RepID=A0ABY5Z4M8_9ACTN|nr:PadR family transcriptional regulator [Dactylosporangium roseum]UWZ36511.1 helix-turn-helix transcriptional regulator [Dactylosporangium roseum]
MGQPFQITTNVARVLRALLDDPGRQHYGYALMRASGLKSGALYPILARLEAAEWIEGHREVIEEAEAGRPARRYYTLTTDGAVHARRALAELHQAIGYTRAPVQSRPAGGVA